MKNRFCVKQIGGILALFLIICQIPLPIYAETPQSVLPGGMAFGVKFACNGLIIVGFAEVDSEEGNTAPAYEAGLRINDKITLVDGKPVGTAEEFASQIENNGKPIEICYERNGQEHVTTLVPLYSQKEAKYKTGMWIRDTTAGIGTVTFIIPETGEFIGLGHGICDQTTNQLLPLDRGTVLDVSISGISKGARGRPGELKGYFLEKKTGVLLENTHSGVYGIFHEIPYDKVPEEKLPIGTAAELHDGKAYIYCTLSDDEIGKYTIEIQGKDTADSGNFEICVTDPTLIEKTGGIVQGMSGSPIIQDGKLVGAVTHVLINDPCRGYGIFIENMLEATQ